MDFKGRYEALNSAQQKAVDCIDGPVMVVAGPGTGKTELLSMRVANILRETDTLPQNILCLTFTESGADAMRDRLFDIIGQDAYKVAIHTFHGFGSDIISQYNEYFYSGAEFHAADELSQYEVLRGIFNELDHTNPLATTMNGEYVHINDTLATISDLKKSGLTSSEMLAILDANDETLDTIEPALSDVFSTKINATTLSLLTPIVEQLETFPAQQLPSDVTPITAMILLSLKRAIDNAEADTSTKPITAWKNRWLEKNDENVSVFKQRKRQVKLRAALVVYDLYLARMQDAKLYDFDDMILQLVHVMETQPELKFNLQEKYQYIMVDEFQDTNMAQARILHNLTSSDVSGDQPNIMVVGDDDQAIYSFQGADVSNILTFQQRYPKTVLITLSENYRSAGVIIDAARRVITQGDNRLEQYFDEIDKTLHAVKEPANASISLREYDSEHAERQGIVDDIKTQIANRQKPETIAVLARRHKELVSLLPYFAEHNIAVNYEKRDNVLENELILLVERIAHIVLALAEKQHDDANALLPELLAHPAWQFEPKAVWKLSLSAYTNRQQWLEVMQNTPEFVPLWEWLVTLSHVVFTLPLERLLDTIIGHLDTTDDTYVSPLKTYYFSDHARQSNVDDYVRYLEALQTIRAKLRDYNTGETPTLKTFVEFIELHRTTDTPITNSHASREHKAGSVNIMTAHKAKGQEFDCVYVIGAVDSAWGEKVRSRSRLIAYPENVPIGSTGNTLDERLRLFFVAMTRAKRQLVISHAAASETSKAYRIASFLTSIATTSKRVQTSSTGNRLQAVEHAWYAPLIQPISSSMKAALAPTLERYKLSATHLNNFLDVSRGGPQTFLLANLLRFPSAMSPAAAYGSAIHAALQRTHTHLSASGQKRPHEDILHDFEQALAGKYLTPDEFEFYLAKGTDTLEQFLANKYDSFSPEQKVELSFAGQHVMAGQAKLTGALDLVDIDEHDKTIVITDYKTGKPSRSWQGKTDYEKIKLHKYKQQLMLYYLLIKQSRDYRQLTPTSGVIQFVEPTPNGEIVSLERDFSSDELATFMSLIEVVWQKIMALDLPDVSQYDATYKGMLAFEQDLLDSKA